eukprot:5311393-Pleurochrysis_carterae.AAC.1
MSRLCSVAPVLRWREEMRQSDAGGRVAHCAANLLPRLPRLRTLDLSYSDATDEVVRAAASCALTSLSLEG